jgi:hypothetical protein
MAAVAQGGKTSRVLKWREGSDSNTTDLHELRINLR